MNANEDTKRENDNEINPETTSSKQVLLPLNAHIDWPKNCELPYTDLRVKNSASTRTTARQRRKSTISRIALAFFNLGSMS
uniref:Uncharacterized protein n=1 Tax=Glossina austeni TaxID=7395 RepID=A0A1A9VGL9_GLOAU